MAEPQTNLQVLKRSRAKPQAGDIFAMQMCNGLFYFGRVIGADLAPPQAPTPAAYLVYVYRHGASTPQAPTPALTVEHLLLPPVFINRMPRTKGYFITTSHLSLSPQDVLPQQRFRDWTGLFVDDQGRPLPEPVEPCGD